MHKILVAGAGKIGSLISQLLSNCGDYQVTLIDINNDNLKKINLNQHLTTATVDVSNKQALSDFLKKNPQDAIMSCLPYFCNFEVAELVAEFDMHYFDLTEDTQVTAAVKQHATGSKKAWVPQCGLAPGFIGIVANSLMREFDSLDTVKLRVGALPINASNVLQYALTWSTDGLINEYGNPCHAIENGENVLLHPLEGLEHIEVDGRQFEAFNTSGGLGSLAEIYVDKVKTLNYKTMRYPGHRDRIYFLMNDLGLNHQRDILKTILENALPRTHQDMVLIYVSVTGQKNGEFTEANYVNEVYPQTIGGQSWAAIQVTTACGVCAVIDLVLENPDAYQGFVYQESFSLEQVIENRFGKHYTIQEG